MTGPKAQKLAYRPELDGVRAFAVLAVMAFHLARVAPLSNWPTQGGFLGVDIFFVLSGMLITELLLADGGKPPGQVLRRFYIRRARRLIPAVAVMLAAALAYYGIEFQEAGQTVSGLGSLAMFVTVGHRGGDPYPWGVTHVWTLIVEWEFYLIWPIALLFLLKRQRQAAIGLISISCAFVLADLGALAYNVTGDSTYPYFIGWFRFDELLVGCAVALAVSTTTFSPPLWLRTIAVAALLTTIIRCSADGTYLNDGGTFVVALATAAVVWPSREPWWATRLLATRPMVWIGKLSYSLYLWSVPVTLDVARQASRQPEWLRIVLAATVSFAIAAASYYLVERAFRLPSQRATGSREDPILTGTSVRLKKA